MTIALLNAVILTIVTRTSRPSLTSCRTSERAGSPLPFLLPHDPSTLGTGPLSDLLEVSNRRHSVFNRAPLLTHWRLHRAGLSSFSDRYFCQSSDKFSHIRSSKSIRMSLFAQTDVQTERPQLLSICGFEYKAVTVAVHHLLLLSRISSLWSTHSTLPVSPFSLFPQGLVRAPHFFFKGVFVFSEHTAQSPFCFGSSGHRDCVASLQVAHEPLPPPLFLFEVALICP